MKQEHIDLIDEWCNILEIKTNKDIPAPNKTYFWFKINKKYISLFLRFVSTCLLLQDQVANFSKLAGHFLSQT